MKKIDFINKTEQWLVDNDIIDSDYKMSPSQMERYDINAYIGSVKWMLQDKGSSLLPEFKKMVKESHVRGMER